LSTGASLAHQPGDEHGHVYLSTACWHGQREKSPLRAVKLHMECGVDATRWDGSHKIAATCKWCPSPCVCPCHQDQ